MLLSKALSTARRRRGFMSGSPPPIRAATVISLMSRVKILPRFASWRPLRCWMFAHLLCPAIWVSCCFVLAYERENVMVTFASRPSPERKSLRSALRKQSGGWRQREKDDGENRRAQGPDPADARGHAREPKGRAHHHRTSRGASRRFRGGAVSPL